MEGLAQRSKHALRRLVSQNAPAANDVLARVRRVRTGNIHALQPLYLVIEIQVIRCVVVVIFWTLNQSKITKGTRVRGDGLANHLRD